MHPENLQDMRRYATLLTALILAGSLLPAASARESTPEIQEALKRVAAAAASYEEALLQDSTTPPAPAPAARRAAVPVDRIFAGGGTPVSNGVFFPGTALCSGNECDYVTPLPQVEKGNDITFVNLDEATVANAHRIVCKKRTKRGRPLCISKQLSSPGEQARMITSKLKPGVYDYFCSVHFGMDGAFEIVP